MSSSALFSVSGSRTVRRVLILADESAEWKIAGVGQLDRLLLSLRDYAATEQTGETISVCVFWNANAEPVERLRSRAELSDSLDLTAHTEDFLADERPIDLVLSTRLFLYRGSIPRLLAQVSVPAGVKRIARGCGRITRSNLPLI